MDSATGEDSILHAEILEILDDALAYLCNECVGRKAGPSTWFKKVMLGLLKKGKLNIDPDSYRIIALESCVLKVLTLLIHKRITDWANARGLIPDYQNGFREGYRTNNNPFILRRVKEWARAKRLSLYVAAVDATNAFPSTDHPTLWLKLMRMGMGGAILTGCACSMKVEYYVRHGDRNSAEFKALIGLLTGDQASSVLWNLFMADLVMADDPDDPVLFDVRIALLAQADDIQTQGTCLKTTTKRKQVQQGTVHTGSWEWKIRRVAWHRKSSKSYTWRAWTVTSSMACQRTPCHSS
jgi:hypothetical protein